MTFAESLAFKIGIMIIVFVLVWMTSSAFADRVKITEHALKIREVGEYVSTKAVEALGAVKSARGDFKAMLDLPALDKDYLVSISCDDGLVVNASSAIIGESFITNEWLNCSGINASGTTFAGHRCITASNDGSVITLRLVNDCGLT